MRIKATDESTLKIEFSSRKVAVLLSGGKDSAVSAALLKKEGWKISLFYLKGWGPDELECTDPVDRLDAYRVADSLGLPLNPFYWSDLFWGLVFAPFFDGYFSGITPNPDTLCNSAVKFGVFVDFAFTKLKVDFVASGHYARLYKTQNDDLKLLRAIDQEKDQSYFLYSIRRNLLRQLLFPMGEFIKKTDVPKLIQEYELPKFLLTKRSTRNICFLVRGPDGRAITIKELLDIEGRKRGVEFRPGPIVDEKGKIVGEHDGVSLFAATIGQRKGIGIVGKNHPYYVVGKNISTNTLRVASRRAESRSILLHNLNWLVEDVKNAPLRCEAKIRTPQTARNCAIERIGDDELTVTFDQTQESVAPGQACVLYSGEIVLGGGVIAKTSL